MEYCDQGTVNDAIMTAAQAAQALPAATVLLWTYQLASALAHLAAAGIVHRDLKVCFMKFWRLIIFLGFCFAYSGRQCLFTGRSGETGWLWTGNGASNLLASLFLPVLTASLFLEALLFAHSWCVSPIFSLLRSTIVVRDKKEPTLTSLQNRLRVVLMTTRMTFGR